MSGFGFIEVLIALGLSATLSAASFQSIKKMNINFDVAQQQLFAFEILDASTQLTITSPWVLKQLKNLPQAKLSGADSEFQITWQNRQSQYDLSV